jgi:hypothetical protein
VLTLSGWYADGLRRHDQLSAWTAGAVATPNSVWLPGLFNPKAFLTAVMQTYARARGLPLDVMRFVTDVTDKNPQQVGSHGSERGPSSPTLKAAFELQPRAPPADSSCPRKTPQLAAGRRSRPSLNTRLPPENPSQITEPAPAGCYVHGLVLEGARWDRAEGRLKDSAPGELHQPMPVIQVGRGSG